MRSESICSAILAAALAACGGDERDTLTLYCAHDALFSEPILELFEARTGIEVEVVGDTEAAKTVGLVRRLIQLAERPEADVFWNNEILGTLRLAELGLLERHEFAGAAGIPAEFRDPEGRWLGFGARARVLVYNTELLAEAEAPSSLFELAEPRFANQVALANPLFGTSATHAAALFAVLGEERARAFYLALKANGCRIAAGNAMACALVADGELALALTDSDDAMLALRAKKPIRMVLPDQDGLGTLVVPNTVMRVRGGPHGARAGELVDWIASAEVEALLAAGEAAQMPVRPELAPPSAELDLEKVRAMAVDWPAAASKAEVAARFLTETFLE
jgi:iron(III) transport system substrate-binding protein